MRLIVMAIFVLSITACNNLAQTKREPVQYKTPSSVADYINKISTEDKSNITKQAIKTSSETTKESGMKVSNHLKVSCKSGVDVRTLTFIEKDSGSCLVIYERGGQKSTVASNKNDLIHCKMVYTRMKLNFIDSGFSCK